MWDYDGFIVPPYAAVVFFCFVRMRGRSCYKSSFVLFKLFYCSFLCLCLYLPIICNAIITIYTFSWVDRCRHPFHHHQIILPNTTKYCTFLSVITSDAPYVVQENAVYCGDGDAQECYGDADLHEASEPYGMTGVLGSAGRYQVGAGAH